MAVTLLLMFERFPVRLVSILSMVSRERACVTNSVDSVVNAVHILDWY